MKPLSLTISLITIFILTIFLTACGRGNNMTTVKLDTNQGTIEIELFTEQMPITTANFIKLANDGFYDGTKFHRVIKGFMIQGGDPLSKNNNQKDRWGTGGPGYTIKDEFGDVGNNKGTIAMANAGPHTGGSQFFINLVNNNFLDDKHPVFGKVTSGMDIVEKIGKTPTGFQDQPTNDIIIEKITIS